MFYGEPFGGIIPGARGAVLAALLRTGTPLTGRQVHRLVSGAFSLWTVQEALKALAQLGLVETQVVGRAGLHKINEAHVATAPLRVLLDPVAALRTVVQESVDGRVVAVLLFGSVARGTATADSDIDLAVIAGPEWDGRAELAETVLMRLGNDCDVVVFGESEFAELALAGESVARDILRDGIALLGAKPRITRGAA